MNVAFQETVIVKAPTKKHKNKMCLLANLSFYTLDALYSTQDNVVLMILLAGQILIIGRSMDYRKQQLISSTCHLCLIHICPWLAKLHTHYYFMFRLWGKLCTSHVCALPHTFLPFHLSTHSLLQIFLKSSYLRWLSIWNRSSINANKYDWIILVT